MWFKPVRQLKRCAHRLYRFIKREPDTAWPTIVDGAEAAQPKVQKLAEFLENPVRMLV
jgi:hypothetical protein